MSLKHTDNGIELQEGKLLLSDLSCWFGLAPTTLSKRKETENFSYLCGLSF